MQPDIEKFLSCETLDKKTTVAVLNKIAKFDVEDGPSSYDGSMNVKVDDVIISKQTVYDKIWDQFSFVDRFGGEGQGDTAWVVLRHNKSEQHYRFTFSYQSYHGFEYDYGYWSSVTPKEVVVVQYAED